MIKFEFTGNSVDKPLFSKASKEFGVEFNILTSQMDYVGGVKFGFTIAQIIGNSNDIKLAQDFLTEHQVGLEVIGYVA